MGEVVGELEMTMQTERASWGGKVWWLVLATSILIVGGLWLRWWTARGTIREIHRLGGRYSAVTSAGIRGAFEVILAVDVTVDEITFEKTDVPDELFDRLGALPSLRAIYLKRCKVNDWALPGCEVSRRCAG